MRAVVEGTEEVEADIRAAEGEPEGRGKKQAEGDFLMFLIGLLHYH